MYRPLHAFVSYEDAVKSAVSFCHDHRRLPPEVAAAPDKYKAWLCRARMWCVSTGSASICVVRLSVCLAFLPLGTARSAGPSIDTSSVNADFILLIMLPDVVDTLQ